MIVCVEEFKDYLKIQQDDEDAVIANLLNEAQAAAEDYCHVKFDSDAPPAAKFAIKLMVAHYYERRDSSDKYAYQAMRLAFQALLYPHRDPNLMF
jgi:uncharacterized phage protein (predicted DNA packaging)